MSKSPRDSILSLFVSLFLIYSSFSWSFEADAMPTHPALEHKVVILTGPPGAGKGTQAEELEKRFGVFHLSTGDLLAAEAKRDTPLGREIAPIMKSGGLVPAKIVDALLAKKLSEILPETGILLDGYPRSVSQVATLAELLKNSDRKIDFVFFIDLKEDVAVKRLEGRRVCPKCRAGYHLEAKPPKVAGICDEDGTPLIQRPDDVEATIRDRYKAYRKETLPVIAELKKLAQVVTLDGEDPEKALAEKIAKIVAPK